MYHIKYTISAPFEERSCHGIKSGFREQDKELYSDYSMSEILSFLDGITYFKRIESVNHIIGEVMKLLDVSEDKS